MRATSCALLAALAAAAIAWWVHGRRNALDDWYQDRLSAAGFDVGGGHSEGVETHLSRSYVHVNRVLDMGDDAYETEARHLVELAGFKQFLAKSKVPVRR